VDGEAQLALRAGLDRLGWVPGGGVSAYCLTAPVSGLRVVGDRTMSPGLDLVLTAEPDVGWLATYRYRGMQFPPQAGGLLVSAPEQRFFSIREITADGSRPVRTVAVARGSLAGGWVCLTAVDVAPDRRRRGLARALLVAVADWAASRGAASAMLQVAVTNGPALRLYTSAGFTVHHRYDYLVPGAMG
jgi:N-acetylglutamate synthase